MENNKTEKWFAGVFNDHYEHLRNYLYYLSGDVSWAEDATQEAFLVIWEKRADLKQETLRPYLFTTGKNLFLKRKRRENVWLKFTKTAPSVEEAEEQSLPAELEEFDKQLQSAISLLPEKCRIVFLMSRLDGLANRQIAETLDISVKAVEKQITRALKQLRESLEAAK